MADSIYEQVCVFCKHMWINPGEYDYSDVTPGYCVTIRCGRDHWEIDTYEDGVPEYRQKIMMAQGCPDFSLAEGVTSDDP